jgi:hypothetical protein
MPQLTGVEGTVLGGILIFLGYVLNLVIPKKKKGGDTLEALVQGVAKVVDKNASISEELLLYLKTRDAGKDVENIHYAEQLNRIEGKLDKHIEDYIKCMGK